jgi:hypothetical protein
MEESPFRDNWSWFGFDGEPDQNIDYSWFRIQDSLTFDGINNVVSNCSLYYSSRKPNHFLVHGEHFPDELWDSTDCSFRIIPEIPSAIEVSSERRIFIMWGCSTALIEMLTRDRKLPPSTLQGKIYAEGIPIKYSRTSARRDISSSIEKLDQ